MEKQDTDNKSKLKRAFTILLIVFALVLSGFFWYMFFVVRDGKSAATDMPSPDTATPTVTPMETETPRVFEGWLADYAKTPDREIDFAQLKAINSDVCAWISVPGTKVDFPVMYAEKNDWTYLDYDINKQPSLAGAIFTDGWNSADFSDPVTMVYGHNMKDGTMFASLHWFRDARFFENNRSIFIYIDDYMLEYEIFGAYETSDEHILATYDVSDPAVFTAYLQGIQEIRDLSANMRDVPLSADDRLITLVSSVQDDENARYFIQGVLRKNK